MVQHTVSNVESDYAEIGEHVLTVTEGRIQYDKIWQCERCGAERTHLEYYEGVECDADE